MREGGALAWLGTEEAALAGTGKFRFTILSELGRIANPETRREVARQVCELKPKVRAAVLLIRRYRNGSGPVATVDGLVRALAEALDAYAAGHDGVTLEAIGAALKRIAAASAEVYDG